MILAGCFAAGAGLGLALGYYFGQRPGRTAIESSAPLSRFVKAPFSKPKKLKPKIHDDEHVWKMENGGI